MRRLLIVFFIAFSILAGIIYISYINDTKCERNKLMEQLRFELKLLEVLDKYGKEDTARLLAGDIQRPILLLLKETNTKAVEKICTFFDATDIKRLEK